MTPTSHAGLSAELARHVCGARFEQLSPTTVHATCRAVLDAIGVMQAASGLAPEVRPFIDLAVAQQGVAESTVLGGDVRVPAALAAFANGAMAHALDYEDAFDAAPVHPNASLIPAVLALAQSRAPVSGRELVIAIAVRCDLTCRLGLCLRRPLEEGGWYPPPILGAFGAVAGAARLLRLSPQQMRDAWSLVLLQNSCPGEIKYSAASGIRAVREAFPAQAAVTSALLVEAGIRGFDEPFEGRAGFFRLFAENRYDPADLFDDLGTRWSVNQLSFKPWPSCRGTHAAIEAALQLRSQADFDLHQIERITVEGGTVQAMLAQPVARKSAPSTAIDAKFSLPFTVATALLKGEVTLDSFTATALADTDIRELATRVHFCLRDDWGREQAVCGAVSLHLRGGQEHRVEILDARGSPSRPLTDEQLIAKFVDCVGRAVRPVGTAPALALARRLLDLPAEPDAGALI